MVSRTYRVASRKALPSASPDGFAPQPVHERSEPLRTKAITEFGTFRRLGNHGLAPAAERRPGG